MEANMVGWFEIPVIDMTRARQFYEKVFDIKIHIVEMGETEMGWFPFPKDPQARGAGGALIQNVAHYKPADNGVLIYFSSEEISAELKEIPHLFFSSITGFTKRTRHLTPFGKWKNIAD